VTAILHGKLLPPRLRHSPVFRPRLIARLGSGLTGKLILVSAPAGFGKSTLVADWINRLGDRSYAAWLSLGPEENDLGRFLTYLVAAVARAAPHLQPAIRLAFDSEEPGTPVAESAAKEQFVPLLNTLAALDRPLILVLDDYHVITDCGVHTLLRSLIHHLPETVTTAVLTRADPPVHLGRLAVQKQLTSIRAADLRFSPAEAALFLRDVMRRDLSNSAVERLARRTEGWITGLQLAALSLQQQPDVAGFLDEFAGDDHNVRRYLIDEVLAGQPAEIQQFMLATSILERLTAPLCEAVVGDEQGTLWPGRMTAQQALEYLDDRNLFIVALDGYGQWYRYHTLFAELLRFRLWSEQRERLPHLHRRAACWLEQQGLIDEAVRHARAVGDGSLEQTILLHAQRPAGINGRFAFLLGRLRRQLQPPQTGASPVPLSANGHQYARGAYIRPASPPPVQRGVFGASETAPAPPGELRQPLSERESEVLGLLAQGLSYQDIANRLVISLPTVKTHVSHVYSKLDVHSREEALEQAARLGLRYG
jgi:LuxR family transcriptional regulator, maltose regulon positive regulatory protein